jgi:hypothetical protein
MAKLVDQKVPASTLQNLGVFKVGVFNLFIEPERAAYEELRTKAKDPSTGIKIEHLQQFTRVVTEIEDRGDKAVTSKREDLYMLVQYFERTTTSVDRPTEAAENRSPRDYYVEREAKG